MPDRDKVIRIIDELIYEAQKEPTWKAENALRCVKKELLKEQEAVSITTDYFDGFGNRTSHCPSCNSRLVWHQNKNYCGECGRSVKWDA